MKDIDSKSNELTRNVSDADWFQQATPLITSAELKVNEVKGLISFTFDLVIPPAELLSETYENSFTEDMQHMMYGLRQQFPIHQGAGT